MTFSNEVLTSVLMTESDVFVNAIEVEAGVMDLVRALIATGGTPEMGVGPKPPLLEDFCRGLSCTGCW